MRLRDLLDESLVKVRLESIDKEECIEEMVDLLIRSGRLASREVALEAIRTREACGTTGCGNGCAVPHGRHVAISGIHVAVGTSAEGIDFDAVDGSHGFSAMRDRGCGRCFYCAEYSSSE